MMKTMIGNNKKYNHIALVRRDDLITLFKNGVIYPSSSLEFKCNLHELVSDSKAEKKLFDKVTLIEYSINYFILYAKTEKSSSLFSQGLRNTDLISIFPLDENSARMGLNFEPPVKLEKPIFSIWYRHYEKNAAVENAISGINNVAKIFEIDDLEKSIKKFNLKKDLPNIIKLMIDDENIVKPKTIWEYLISYSRSHSYPNDVRGAFLDSMTVIHNFSKGQVINKDQKLTSTGKEIMAADGLKFDDIANIIAFSPMLSQAASKAYKGFLEIASLYFMLVNCFSDTSESGDYIKGKPLRDFINSIKIHYHSTVLKPALLLLGITLGQSSTYKILYSLKKDQFPFLAT